MLLPLTKRIVIMGTGRNCRSRDGFAQAFTEMGAPTVDLCWLYNTNFASQLVNELFYDNSLTSFCCTRQKKNGINVINQIGTYDRRKTRVNVIEASAVVDEVLRLKTEDPSLTVGIYALTDEQRALIEILVKKRIGASETFKSTSEREPFFIRSLSQSEYDSRDVILFSTALSVEERSKYSDTVSRSIQELSDDEAVGRLINVLTSARKNFTLVTSLSVEVLSKFKTTEANYCIFKRMIQRLLAEGNYSLQDPSNVTAVDNSIIRCVANHIESLGYKVDLNVGINNCKIDIAVKKKGKNSYVLGVIFDETAYVNSDDFYGRDLMIKGLETFGNWKIFRIYTVEWFENYSKQLDLISIMLEGDNFENEFSMTQRKE